MRAIYVRTSPTQHDDGEAQLYELRRHAAARDWHGWQEYVDRSETGRHASRPEWDRLRADIRAGRVTEMMSTEVARLGRSALAVLLALDELHKAGCRVILTRQGLDYGTPTGRAVAQILAAVAELELEQRRERTEAGLRRAREHGTRSGKPIGRPERSVDLGRAHSLRATGHSWRDCAAQLGVPVRTLRRRLGRT